MNKLPTHCTPRVSFYKYEDGCFVITALLPLGITSEPMYHLEYLSESQGLKTKWLLCTWDFNPAKAPLRGGIWNLKNWRRQKQVKHFGTRFTVMVEK